MQYCIAEQLKLVPGNSINLPILLLENADALAFAAKNAKL